MHCLTHSSCVEVTAFFHLAGSGSVMNAGHPPSNRALSPVGVVSVVCRPACPSGVIPCSNDVTAIVIPQGVLLALWSASGDGEHHHHHSVIENVISSHLNLRHIRLAYGRLTGLREAFLLLF